MHDRKHMRKPFEFDDLLNSESLTITSQHVGKILRRTGPQAVTGDRSYIGETFLVVAVYSHGMDVRRLNDKYSDLFGRQYPNGKPMFMSFHNSDYQDGRWELVQDMTGDEVIDGAMKTLMQLGVKAETYAEYLKKMK